MRFYCYVCRGDGSSVGMLAVDALFSPSIFISAILNTDMKILLNGYLYESQGIIFDDLDVKELLESHNVHSLESLNSLLEAIEDKNKQLDEEIPDLELTPESKAEVEKMQKNAPLSTPETDSEEPADEDVISDTPEEPATPVEPPEDLDEDLGGEDLDESEPDQEIQPEIQDKSKKTSDDKKKEDLIIRPETEPPAIPPKKELPPELEKPQEWLPSKKLSTLYNNFIDLFGDPSPDKAGYVTGLNAPGLKHDSKYLQCDITADVQGKEKKPYRVWIKLRRRRNTQNWSFNNPCEVRCTCKAFSYYVAYSNLKNKSLAGTPVKNKSYIDDNGVKRVLNFTLPSVKNNPGNVPALCKHLALVAKKLLDNGMITEE